MGPSGQSFHPRLLSRGSPYGICAAFGATRHASIPYRSISLISYVSLLSQGGIRIGVTHVVAVTGSESTKGKDVSRDTYNRGTTISSMDKKKRAATESELGRSIKVKALCAAIQ